MNTPQTTDKNYPKIIFPFSIHLKVGDIVSFQTTYIFQGDIFNGEYRSDLFKFLGIYKRHYKEKKNGYCRGFPEELLVFERLYKDDIKYSYCGGRLICYHFYNKEEELLKLEQNIDIFVYGNSLEDLKRAYCNIDELEFE